MADENPNNIRALYSSVGRLDSDYRHLENQISDARIAAQSADMAIREAVKEWSREANEIDKTVFQVRVMFAVLTLMHVGQGIVVVLIWMAMSR